MGNNTTELEWIDFIRCPICDKKFKILSSHIRCKHNLSLNEFVLKYNYKKLTADSYRLKYSEVSKKFGCGKWRRGAKLTEEHKNKLSQLFSGEKNPFYGKKHTDETKEKMSKNHADFTGEKNPLVRWLKNDLNMEAYKQLMKEKCEKERQNLDWVKHKSEALSKSMSKAHLDGKMNFGKNHKHGYFLSKKQNINIFYRSSYELKFLELCENNDTLIKFNTCSFRIEYRDNINNIMHYIPDFILNDLIIVEIKPKSMIKYGNNVIKIQAGIDYCSKNNLIYKLITEDDLNNEFLFLKNLHI